MIAETKSSVLISKKTAIPSIIMGPGWREPYGLLEQSDKGD